MEAQHWGKCGNVSTFPSTKFVVSTTFPTRLFQMPRKIIGRKPKGKLKNWDAQSMMKAIVSVREKKMGLRKAVKLYEVPQTSLQRFVNSDKTPEECKPQSRTKACFTC